ncbi:MAG: alpha-galactosidase [Chloroflexi bacterium]|uniref:alpha-galactosidase n=1 Tax=Candidatus Roseilinea sp. NK_OTU-006 TaxID=2704250 RepID=UPI000F22B20B|nr:alpha-galactosidase [Candidatus Roseilinea sp. NK_OTU-006]RMG65836.1 MAG: alpha-galactosidase [Chloroflexota bacterium]
MELHLHPPAEALLQKQGLTLAHLRLTAWNGESAEPLSLPVQWHLSAPEAGFWTLHFDLSAPDRALEITRLRLEAFLPQALWGQEGTLWSLQGAAVHWGQDFAFPLEKGFARENYLGHLQDAEGGGVPLVYLWNRLHGLALMHLETTPIEWYLPVERDEEGVRMAFELRRPLRLTPGQVWSSPLFALSWHEGGDFFAPLERYRQQMAVRGLTPAPPLPASYEAAWCSWGYEFDVTAEDVAHVLPAARPMGLRWFTLDDRWFDAYGDWNPRRETFPNGAEDLRRMNEAIHAAGGLSQLWWYPLCAEDGHGAWESHTYGISQILREHPDWVVLDEQGRVARNNRHLAMLCPALPEVQEYTLALTRRFIEEWGFDGFKMDNIYTMPACHNPAHHHASPQESIRAFGELYRRVLELTRQLRPQEGVVQICPCGTPITFHLLPATDQTVTADPTSSAQVRQRIKFYKALTGRSAAVFADHVELSDGGVDFASGIATGGVPGTKFTWQVPPERQARLKENWQLSAQKFELWRFWFDLYQRYRLAEGEYLDLYDMAFDFPEAHVIRKDGRRYYAFFAESFDAELQLRGLEARRYRLRDYEHETDLGTVEGPKASLRVRFTHHLLLEATPE